MAELLVDGDEPHRVPQPFGVPDHVDAGERRHDHRVRGRQYGAVVELDLAGAGFRDDRVRQPLDPELVEEAVDHLLGVADAAEPEVAEEWFGGDEGDRRDVLQAGLLDPVVRVEHELVGRAEARAALRRADHNRTGVPQEPVPLITGEEGVLEVADRLRVPVVRSETWDLLEREPRTGPDEQPVIGEFLAGARRHGVRDRVDLLGGLVDEPDPPRRHRVTVRHLLTHTSGLPPFKEYWRTSKNKQDTLTKIFAEPLEYEPGTKEVYSDLGIILMAEIVERLTGRTLDDLAKTYIFSPLGMKDTTYRPAQKLWPWIAPTEFDRNLRNRLVQGEVHDENAFTMGGVSGHAGVFSTAPDLAAFCQMLLNGGVYAHQRILKRATIAQFTTPQTLSNGTRTLGWAVPTAGSSSGHFFSTHSFGHTGFTGTSIWIDQDRQIFVVLLTNRVNPTRENQKIAQVRPAFHDAVMQALGFGATAGSGAGTSAGTPAVQ